MLADASEPAVGGVGVAFDPKRVCMGVGVLAPLFEVGIEEG